MSLDALLTTRAAEPGDHGFIFTRWTGTRRDPKPVVAVLMKHASIRVVCSKARVTTVHGFAAVGADALLMAFILPGMRGRGLVRRMVTELFGGYPERVVCAHPWPFDSDRYVSRAQRAA